MGSSQQDVSDININDNSNIFQKGIQNNKGGTTDNQLDSSIRRINEDIVKK